MEKVTEIISHDTRLHKSVDQYQVAGIDERQRLIGVMAHANQIAHKHQLSDLHQEMLDLMIEVSESEMGLVYLLDSKSDEFVILSERGKTVNPYFTGLRFKRSLEIIGTTFSDNKPVIVCNLVDSNHWLRAIDPIFAANLKNVISLPLILDGVLVGAIQLFNFQRAELELLQVLGERLIHELDRMVTAKHTHNTNKKLRDIIDIIASLTGNLNRDHLLQKVTEYASSLLSAERSSVFLVDPNNAELNFQVSYQSDDPDSIQSGSSEEALIINLFMDNRSSRGKKTRTDSVNGLSQGGFGFSTRSAITVPLKTGSFNNHEAAPQKRTFGGLMVVNKINGDFTPEDNQYLNILADQTSTFLQIAEIFENANDLFLGLVKSMVTAIDAKDPYTQGHSLRVSEVSVAIAEELGTSADAVNDIRVGSLLHDIGKIGIPDYILKKRGSLTAEEFNEIKRHTVVGHNILRQARALQPLLPAIIGHHERLDGTGYPYGLKGDDIPFMSRVVAVADVFDAMASERPYRPAIPIPAVIRHLQKQAGLQLDGECVQALINADGVGRIDFDYSSRMRDNKF